MGGYEIAGLVTVAVVTAIGVRFLWVLKQWLDAEFPE